MTYTFIKYAFINALWTLIPIFPIWTLFPGIFAVMQLEQSGISCQTSYTVLLWLCILLAVTTIATYLLRLSKAPLPESKVVKRSFRLVNLLLYTLVNTAALILVVGTHLACNGDGQTILACIISGPIASVSIILFGLVVDLRVARVRADVNE